MLQTIHIILAIFLGALTFFGMLLKGYRQVSKLSDKVAIIDDKIDTFKKLLFLDDGSPRYVSNANCMTNRELLIKEISNAIKTQLELSEYRMMEKIEERQQKTIERFHQRLDEIEEKGK